MQSLRAKACDTTNEQTTPAEAEASASPPKVRASAVFESEACDTTKEAVGEDTNSGGSAVSDNEVRINSSIHPPTY